MLWMGMVIMDSQNRKGALYQIVAFVLAKPALLILAKLSTLVLVNSLQSFWRNSLRSFSDEPESGLRYNFEMDLFG